MGDLSQATLNQLRELYREQQAGRLSLEMAQLELEDVNKALRQPVRGTIVGPGNREVDNTPRGSSFPTQAELDFGSVVRGARPDLNVRRFRVSGVQKDRSGINKDGHGDVE